MCVSSSKQFAPTRMSGRPDSRRSRLRMGDPGNLFVEARSWHNAFLLLPWWFSKTRPCKLAKQYKQSSHRVRLTWRTAPVMVIKAVVRLEKIHARGYHIISYRLHFCVITGGAPYHITKYTVVIFHFYFFPLLAGLDYLQNRYSLLASKWFRGWSAHFARTF